MELSAELYEKTIRDIKGDVAAGAQDRRSHPRVGFRCKIQIIPINGGVVGKPVDVWTRDISRGGISVISSLKLKVGERFALRLPRGEGEQPLGLLCTVKTVHELGSGVYALGAAFEALQKTPVQSGAAA
jgi:hypothetical protein